MNENWVTKFKPLNLNEYDNNIKQINEIEELIQTNTNIIIKGDSGIGKIV